VIAEEVALVLSKYTSTEGALGARCIRETNVFGGDVEFDASFKHPLNSTVKKDSAPKSKKAFFLTCTVFIFS
jgi:hypothetical protein